MVAPRTKADTNVAPASGPPPAASDRGNGNGARRTNGSARSATAVAHRGPPSAPTVKQQAAALLQSVKRRDDDADLAALQRAVDFAIEAHGDQKRASGEPYVTHPIASAQILADLGIDPVAIQAALLHHVPEDTEYALSDIEDGFGSEVAQLVDGVTKLGKFSTLSHEQQQAENIRKMFLAKPGGSPVVLLKRAERLLIMRPLAALRPEKQLRIARQTLEIYAPLAERLGI